VLEPECRRRLAGILAQELADPSAWVLAPDGSYHQQVSLAVDDAGTAQAIAMNQRTEEVVWAG
jgi:hypothetical protein